MVLVTSLNEDELENYAVTIKAMVHRMYLFLTIMITMMISCETFLTYVPEKKDFIAETNMKIVYEDKFLNLIVLKLHEKVHPCNRARMYWLFSKTKFNISDASSFLFLTCLQ